MFCLCCNPSTPLSASRFFAEAVTDTSPDVTLALRRRAAYERRKTYSRAPVSHPGRIDMIIRHAQMPVGPVDIHVRDSKIVDIGADLRADAMLEVDGRGLVVLPGLRVGHSHPAMDRLGSCIDRADSSDIYRVVRRSLLELMSSGVTYIDHCARGIPSPQREAALLAQIDSGLRGQFIPIVSNDASGNERKTTLAECWPAEVSEHRVEVDVLTEPGSADCARDSARVVPSECLAVGGHADLILVDATRASRYDASGANGWLARDLVADDVVLVCVDGRLHKRNRIVVEPNEGLIRNEAEDVLMRLRPSSHQRAIGS
jgi:hypothetical protein